MSLLTLCLQILPLLLLVVGLGGILGIVSIGPSELPKKAPLNRWLGAATLLMAGGLALYGTAQPVAAEIGLGAAVLAVVIFTLLYRQVRRQYPPTVQSFQDRLRRRYRFKDTSEEDSQSKHGPR